MRGISMIGKTTTVGVSVLLTALFLTACVGPASSGATGVTGVASVTGVAGASSVTGVPVRPPITLTDLYDNRSLQPGLKTGWGFACLVRGYEHTILFDTGADGRTLLSNMYALGVEPSEIDVVVLSHQHSDHTGGLDSLLKVRADLTIYCPASFSSSFTRSAESKGATVVRVDSPESPCPGVTVMTPLRGGSLYESGLLLDTAEGPVLLTGCAHPGVVPMADAAGRLSGRPLKAIIGGFHLSRSTTKAVAAVVAGLQALGVQQCGPAHCTGDRAIGVFEEAFGPDFITMGVGAVVQF